MGHIPSRPSMSAFMRGRPELAIPNRPSRRERRRRRRELVPMAVIVAMVRAGLLRDFSRRPSGRA